MSCCRRKQIRTQEPLFARNFESQLNQSKLNQTCQFDDHFLSLAPPVSIVNSKDRGIDSLFNNSKAFQTHFRLAKVQSVRSRSQKNQREKTKQSSKNSVEKSKKTVSQLCYQLLHIKPSHLEDNMKSSLIKSRLLRRYSLQTQKIQQFSQDHFKKIQENQLNQEKRERVFCKTTMTLSRPNSITLINQRGTPKLHRRNFVGKTTQEQWKELCPWPQAELQDFYF